MPRAKKQHLKQRSDGRFACRYHDLFFYGATEDEALEAREEYKRSEKLMPRASQKKTLAEYAAEWLPIAKPNVAKSTYSESSALLEKLLNVCGDKQIDEVLPSDVKKVYSTYFANLSDSYIRSAKQLYINLFDAAVADDLCRKNPAREKPAQPHRGTKGGHRAITAQERKYIDTYCKDHRAYQVVMAMLYEGLRPPEAKAFNIDDSVDFEKKEIHLKAFAHKGDKGIYSISEIGKTEKSVRTVPLFTPFRNAIENKHGRLVYTVNGSDLTERAWRVLWLSYVHQMETSINGIEKRWYRRTKAHKAILAEAAALRKRGDINAAIEKEKEIPSWIPFTVTPYDLRHSFCTFCRDSGVEINTCIKWMGHSDAKMILKIYDEVSADRSKNEAEKLEKALIRSQNGSQIKVFRVKRSKINAFKR